MRTRAECRDATAFVGTAIGTAETALGMQTESPTPEWYHAARASEIHYSDGQYLPEKKNVLAAARAPQSGLLSLGK